MLSASNNHLIVLQKRRTGRGDSSADSTSPSLPLHLAQPWFHAALSREEATRLLAERGLVDGYVCVDLFDMSLGRLPVFEECFVVGRYHGSVVGFKVAPKKKPIMKAQNHSPTPLDFVLIIIEYYILYTYSA